MTAVGGTIPNPEGSGSLLEKVSKGLGWSFDNNVAARVANVAVGIVLARILVPEDYGVFAVSLVVLTAALSMNELGVSLAVVRWPTRVRVTAVAVEGGGSC